MTRIAAADLCLGGQQIKGGDTVHLVLAAANRDPDIFADPDRFDIDRGGAEPIAFGGGEYRCLGARMATIELEVAIAALARNPDLQLGPGPVCWEARTRVPALASAPAMFGGLESKAVLF